MSKLGKTEYFYWLYDQIECTNFVISASLPELDCSISIEKPLEQTIKNIRRLQERIVRTKNNKLSFQLSHEFRTTVSYMYGDHSKLKKLTIEELSTRFRNSQAPIRVILYLLTTENRLILIITFNHVFTDGLGAMNIFRILINNIYDRNQKVQNKIIAQTPSQESFFPPDVNGIRLLIKGLSIFINRKKQDNINTTNSDPLFKCPAKRSLQLEKIQLNKSQSLHLINTCKKRKISFTSFIAAVQCSVIRDMVDKNGKVQIPIQIPFDNRSKLLPQEKSDTPGLFITIPELRPQVGNDYDIWALARIIGTEIIRISNSWERYMTFQLFPIRLFRPDHRGVEMLKKSLSNKKAATTLTNLGDINKRWESVDSMLVDSLDIAVAPARNCILCTSVLTYNESVYLNLAFNTAIVEEERIKDITDQYLSRLTILCNDQN